ncbi:MAG: AGE family epimerase/isomerase [Corynebacterium sp.]|nr:AGE family epimerase/isomerase [Corynebacterium sp.]
MYPTIHWLGQERDALVDFISRAAVPSGFGYLDERGHVNDRMGLNLWINARFVHVWACEHLRGNPSAWAYLDHGLRALLTNFRDTEYGGWFLGLPATGDNSRKEGFAHAYVALAAASALHSGHPLARELFDAVQATIEEHFIDPATGLMLPAFDRNWNPVSEFHATGPNLHLLESSLAAYDATGDEKYLLRAIRVSEFMLAKLPKHNFHIPEYLDGNWEYAPEYFAEDTKNPDKPWGAQVGHSFEWARLIHQTAVVASRKGLLNLEEKLEWLDYPLKVFLTAQEEAWNNGFAFTTDFQGQPLIEARHWWVMCEALCHGHAILELMKEFPNHPFPTGLKEDLPWLLMDWWKWTQDFLISSPGRWHHELDVMNDPAHVTWSGMPEPYHIYQTLAYPMAKDYALSFAAQAKEQIA